jgi:hypothetical protein
MLTPPFFYLNATDWPLVETDMDDWQEWANVDHGIVFGSARSHDPDGIGRSDIHGISGGTLMDRHIDDGRPRTPLERIKAQHEQMRDAILHGDEDTLDWSEDMHPQQAGLKPVWADSNGKLWVIIRDGDKHKLHRLWEIT